ncbi:hypothetical protein ACQ4LD_21555, partial [Sphingobacterium daejeonense]
ICIRDRDWHSITEDMHRSGYAVIEHLITEEECKQLIELYDQKDIYRKTVVEGREKYRDGLGMYTNLRAHETVSYISYA